MLAHLSRIVLPILILVSALAIYRVSAVGPQPAAVVLPRNVPVAIAPRFNDPRVVTDEQLAAVLDRVKPPAERISTNNFIHALRLWGPQVDFGSVGCDKAATADGTPEEGGPALADSLVPPYIYSDFDYSPFPPFPPAKIPSGADLRDYFLHDATFRKWAGDETLPLFYRGPDGIEVRSYDDRVTNRDTSSFHTNDLVATLAEIGTPLDTPLHMRDGEAKVSDLLTTAISRAHIEQLEIEWTAITYARYVFPQPQWRNKFGEKITVDELVERLISQPPELGPCNGLHRLEALAVLNRADEELKALRPKPKLKMLLYMKRASNSLVAAQTADGFWTRQWPRGASATTVSKDNPATLHDKLLVTGHHLEWLALAPDEVQPPRETIIRAAQWLARTLVEMDQKDLLEAYGPYTHAARALCLWRSVEPIAAWRGQGPEARGQVPEAKDQETRDSQKVSLWHRP